MEPASAAIGRTKSSRNAEDQYTLAEIVSKTAASLVGGTLVTYFVGAAIARTVVRTGLMIPSEAVYLTGLSQIFIFAGAVIWVCATSSIVRTWIGLAAVIAVSAAIARVGLTPDEHAANIRANAPAPSRAEAAGPAGGGPAAPSMQKAGPQGPPAKAE